MGPRDGPSGRRREAGRGQAGHAWLRDAALNVSRRHEELKTRIMEDAGRLAGAVLGAMPTLAVGMSGTSERPLHAHDERGHGTPPSPLAPLPTNLRSVPGEGSDADELFLADRLLNQFSGILQANERLRLLDLLKPVYQRQPAFTGAMKRWRQQQVNCLQQTGQAQEALKLWKQLAADYPHDSGLLQQYANQLAQGGEHETAYRLLLNALLRRSSGSLTSRIAAEHVLPIAAIARPLGRDDHFPRGVA